MKNPVLSVITVNFNNNQGLIKTLESLKRQTFSNYEHIIIDANSTDGSKDTILSWANEAGTHLTNWVSEPDKGIYDGMNKGIKLAQGEYLYFLNSGDLLKDDILNQIPFDGTQYIYGDIELIHPIKGSFIWKYSDVFDTCFLANECGWISQQACFIHRSLFVNHKYDTNYKIISDWIHAVRCILFEGATYKHLPIVVATFDGGGESSNEEITWKERNKWIKENLPASFFKAFLELEKYKSFEFAKLLPMLGKTKKFHKRVGKLVYILYRLNLLFSKTNRQKPHVLYDHQAFEMQRFGGISRYFCEIISRLNIGYNIGIRYCINYYLTTWNIHNKIIPLPRFLYKNKERYFRKRNKRFMQKKLKRDSNYVFHPTYYDPYFLDYIGIHPYVVTVHDMIHELFYDWFPEAAEVTAQKKRIITNANRIIAISENTKKDIVKLLHVNPDKIDVIYHSTSMKPFFGKKSMDLPEKYLLYVGERYRYKNFERFVKVFAKLQKEDADLFLICTGRSFKADEKKLFDELGIADKVRCIKASDKELSELYGRTSLFVYPSLYEGFGIPILEAYACHCPIALSNTSCFPEIAGEAGCYFDPYSEDSMYEAIKGILYDEEKKKELVRLGDERLKLYSWDKAAKATEDVYRKILTRSFVNNQE